MDLGSLSQIEKQIELLVSKSHSLVDKNSTLSNELDRMTLEMEHLRVEGQRLKIEKMELGKSRTDPEQTRELRKRIEILLMKIDRNKLK
jgi:predicted nuclease with TOPRIM domain